MLLGASYTFYDQYLVSCVRDWARGRPRALGACYTCSSHVSLTHDITCFIRWRAGYVRQSGVLIHLFSNGGGEVWTVTITGLSSVAMLIDWFPVVRCKQSGRCVHMKNET